jgi:hypothetical protein
MVTWAVVHALHDAAGNQFLRPKIVDGQFTGGTEE